MIPVITIEGPTASGKSALALQLAQAMQSEIVSADSRQIYKYLNIGTAKPSPNELTIVPHHFIDIVDPKETYSAGMFTKEARVICKDMEGCGTIPVVVGGTGFYVKALLFGLCELEAIKPSLQENLEQRAKVEGIVNLYSELKDIDPITAEKMESTDRQRVIRALAVWHQTGKRLSDFWKEQNEANIFNAFRIYVDKERSLLYQAIDRRVDIMIHSGLLKEIEDLLNRGYTFQDPGLNAVGYKEFAAFYNGTAGLADCIDKIKQHSRNYAKRQVTWFRPVNFHLTIRDDRINLSKVMDSIYKHFAIQK